MLRRVFVGLCVGLVIGGLLAAGLVGLQWPTFALTGGTWMAYLAAIVVGGLTGLVAGKPIWASGAGIEAGLKAFFGTLLGAGAMFALRQWGPAWAFDLSRFVPGAEGPLAQLPEAALPLIGAVLGMFFELDNTGGSNARGPNEPSARKRVATPTARSGRPAVVGARAARPSDDDPEDAGVETVEVGSQRAKR